MFTYTQTSKLRRKVKTTLTQLGDKIQVELTSSLNDLRISSEFQQQKSVEFNRQKSNISPRWKKLLSPAKTLSGNNKDNLYSASDSETNEKNLKNSEIYSSNPEVYKFESTRLRRASKSFVNLATYDKENGESGRTDNPDETFRSRANTLEKLEKLEHEHDCRQQQQHQRSKIKECTDKVQRYFQRNSRITDVNKRLKSQIWSSVVTIVLVEGKNLLACDPETGTSDPYVKFRLGNEKYKSRIIWRSLNPRWLEQFDLHLYDDGDQQLELTVWDKDRSRDDFVGRCVIDLSSLDREITHSLVQELEDGAGTIHLLLTISGTTASETISDLTAYEENPREREVVVNRYAWPRTFQNVKDVGHLTVKVFRATGLAAADLGGKSDPFCVLELGNARLQTQTEYKTLTPSWNKIFTFNVKDINNVLEITVYDEDRDHKVEFLGKIAIPLLRIRNGEKRWYALKDKKLRARAKGNSPQILLEMTVLWNPIRGMIRTLNPREEKYMQQEVKFKRQVFVKNVLRLKNITMHLYEYGKILQSCFEWESTFQSAVALIFWLIICYYFEPWMIPLAGLLIFMKQYLVRKLTGPETVPWDEIADSDLDDEDEEDKDKEEKKSLKERLQAIQEVTQGVQNAIGRIATFGESIKNTFNFTVPYLSWIAVGLLVAAALVLFLVPVRYLLMLWGMNKFFRRILRPHSVPNNELLDLISRIPDDEMLLDYRDLKILVLNEPDRRRDIRKKHKAS